MSDYINKQLMKAVQDDDLDEVQRLLSAGGNVHYQHTYGTWNSNYTPLIQFVRSAKMTELLLQNGARANDRNNWGERLLHLASVNVEQVRILVKYGANVDMQDRKLNSPLNQKIIHSVPNTDVVKELLKYGADINLRNREKSRFQDHNSPFDNAMNKSVSYPEILKLVVTYALFNDPRDDYEKVVNLNSYTKWNNYKEVSTFVDKCVDEVRRMQKYELKDGLSLYKVLKSKEKANKIYAFPAIAKFPIYTELILDFIQPFFDRADLLNVFDKIPFSISSDSGRIIVLDLESACNVAQYLTAQDLFNVIVAFVGFNKCANDAVRLNVVDKPLDEDSPEHNAKRPKKN